VNQTEELRFEVNGHQLAAIATGPVDAPVVLGLHGWLDNAATFNRMLPLLKGMRFIALDLMGHGYSDHRPESMPYYIWDNVADVIGVADDLGLERFSLVGHSMGASVASLTAGAFPERVERLCLIEGVSPLVYETEELPGLMAEAIKKRMRMRSKKLKPYAAIADAVLARANGRFPVSMQAAEWLVNRGVIHREDGIYWRNDPSLVLPSVLRMSEAQVQAFLRSIQASIEIVVAEEGHDLVNLDERLTCLRDPQLYHLPGNHHLHLEPEGAAAISAMINRWFE
jgi:pimeloyl-ACP methyl ester carboxylesterase